MERREKITNYVDAAGDEYKKIALDIHEHPEVSNYEFFACESLSRQPARKRVLAPSSWVRKYWHIRLKNCCLLSVRSISVLSKRRCNANSSQES